MMGFLKNGLVAMAALSSFCSAAQLAVKATGGNKTTSLMYGLMHEDINNSGDGGIYAELIQNRALQASEQFPVSLHAWIPVGGTTLSINQAAPLSTALPNSIRVTAASGATGQVGLANLGYWGMDVKVQKYSGSFYVKGTYSGVFTASLRSNLTGEVFGSIEVASHSVCGRWTQHNFTLVPSKAAPNSNNTFAITFDAAAAPKGSLDFNLVSLFPPTYKNRPNGMRVDIMEAFAALNPKFLRLPGGNQLEGITNTTYWKWNETIGPLKDRPGQPNTWGYQTTGGLGLVEYMHWCDDLDLEPVLAVWDGLALDGSYTPEDKIGIFVQYALDEVEFLTGDKSTPYGALRVSLGYPKPWKIRYVEIGNEDWLAGRPTGFDTYKQYRFKAFLDAFNEKYPDIKVISSASIFDNITIPSPAAGDFHEYAQPDVYYRTFDQFDHLTKDNLTLIGEYATVHPNGGTDWNGPLQPFPWWGGSVAEAIFLIGAERNSDRVIGAAYAPSLRNMNRWQWAVTLLQYAADPALTTRSTSWYVLKHLGNHVITETLPVVSDTGFGPLFYVAGNSEKNTGIFKAAVYNTTADVPISLNFEGFGEGTTAELTVLTGPENPYGYNDPFTQVNLVKETTTSLKAGAGGAFTFKLPQLSVAVLETKQTRHPKRDGRSVSFAG